MLWGEPKKEEDQTEDEQDDDGDDDGAGDGDDHDDKSINKIWWNIISGEPKKEEDQTEDEDGNKDGKVSVISCFALVGKWFWHLKLVLKDWGKLHEIIKFVGSKSAQVRSSWLTT